MSKAGDDLRKILQVMTHDVERVGDLPRPPVKPRPGDSVSTPGLGIPAVAVVTAMGVCSIIALLGWKFSAQGLLLLGSIGNLICVSGLFYIWNTRGYPHPDRGSSDLAVEVIKRKSMELERDRLREELDKAHLLVRQTNNRLMAIQEEGVKTEADQADRMVRKEGDIWKRAEGDIQRARADLEAEKQKIIDQHRHDMDALRQEGIERQKMLEHTLNREVLQFKQELANREKKLEEMGVEIVRLQDSLDHRAVAAPTELAEHMGAQNKAFDEERKILQKKFQEQEVMFQQRLKEIDSEHAQSRQELEKRLEELSARAMKLQEALDHKIAGSSTEMAGHIEDVRRTYEAQREVMENKLVERETYYQRKLDEQEGQFASRQMELLQACQSYLKEVEAREEDIDKRERALEGNGKGG